MDLIMFTLLNGIEVVGKSSAYVQGAEVPQNIDVEYPFMIRPVEKAPGQYMLDLYPYSLTNQEGTHRFMTSAVVAFSDKVPEMIANEYNVRTTGLILGGAVDAFANLK